MSIFKVIAFSFFLIFLNKIESNTIDIKECLEQTILKNKMIEREKYLEEQKYNDTLQDLATRYNTKIEVIKYIHDVTKKSEVDFYVVLALINKESSFRPLAKSKSNAVGYCQIKNIVLRDIKRTDLDRYDPKDNILIGALFLKELQTRYKFDIVNALIFYNTGSIKELRNSGYNYAVSILKESNITRDKYIV